MKKKNWTSIGKAFVKKISEQALEPFGFITEGARPKLMFLGPGRVITREEDLFGAFDILAINKSEPPYTWLIQATVGTVDSDAVGQRKRKIIALAPDLAPNVAHKIHLWARNPSHKQLVDIYALQPDLTWIKSEFDFNCPDFGPIKN